MPIVRIELYHGGCFNFVPEMHYLGGQMKLYKGIDTDILGIANLDKVATNLGYRNVTCYYSKFLEMTLRRVFQYALLMVM